MKRHNPEKVNSCFIPKGYRLLNVNEVGTPAVEFKCRAWYDWKNVFSPNSNYKGHSEIVTYIIKNDKPKNRRKRNNPFLTSRTFERTVHVSKNTVFAHTIPRSTVQIPR
jgi:hypothetical protein